MGFHGIPEITCAGTPAEIGLAHGQGARSHIHHSIALYTTLFGETANITWAQARHRAVKYRPTIQRLAPHLYAEMEGIAQGAGVEVVDILTLNVRSEIALTNYSDGCTAIAVDNARIGAVAAGGRGHGIYVAQNWDWVEEAGDALILLDVRPSTPGKPRMLMMAEAGIVGKFGINQNGVGVCMNAIRCGAENSEQLPVHIALRLVLESESFNGARATLDSLGLASCTNIMMGDRTGCYGTMECTPKGNALITPTRAEGAVWHTNHLYAANGEFSIKDHPSKNSFTRLDRIKELSTGKPASVDQIREWLSDEQGTPTSICRSRPPNTVGMERMVTLATIVHDLTKLEVHVSFGKPVENPPVKVMSFGSDNSS